MIYICEGCGLWKNALDYLCCPQNPYIEITDFPMLLLGPAALGA